MYSIERKESSGEVALQVAGELGPQTAHDLRSRLAAEPARDVVLDFASVDVFRGSSLALLLAELIVRLRGHPERSVSIRGLQATQQRLLERLGIGLGENGRVALQPFAALRV